jgi:hypothetical protein
MQLGQRAQEAAQQLLWGRAGHARPGAAAACPGGGAVRAQMGSARAAAGPAAGGGRLGRAFGLGPVR